MTHHMKPTNVNFNAYKFFIQIIILLFLFLDKAYRVKALNRVLSCPVSMIISFKFSSFITSFY